MVRIQSESQIKSSFEILKSLGDIVAIAKHPISVTAAYKDGSLRIAKSYGITFISKSRVPEYLEKEPWLKFQIDLSNNILGEIDRFCYQIDNFVWQARDMAFHNKFDIYFPFSNEWEVEIEII